MSVLAGARNGLQRALLGAERAVSACRRRRLDLQRLERPAVQPYLGWGTTDTLHLQARVLSDRRAVGGSATDPWWRNARAMVSRFLTSEVPGAVLRVTADGSSATVTTGDEGYARVELARTGSSTGWVDTRWQLEVPAADIGDTHGRALVPPVDARFGVISDLDDTVLRTGITSTVTMVSTTFFNNAHTRLPFPGVAEFYRALHADGRNPIFYVSTSPWNLYDLLEEFLRVRGIPAGPMFLTDWGIDRQTFIQPDTRAHKLGAIQRVLTAFPGLPFVLIGDAGQHDPEIYRDVVLAHPGRIATVYIRTLDVPGRAAALGRIRDEMEAAGVPFRYGPQTLGAAVHARGLGLIDDEGEAQVRSAVAAG